VNRNIKKSIVILIVGLLAAFTVFPAFAAPPSNDDFDDATVIAELPFSDSIDKTEATTAPDDPDCVGQGPTVWYAFTSEEDIRVRADTVGSDYDTTLSVYTGSRGALTQIACNDDAVGLQSRVNFDAVAGETYFFMVGAFGSGPGGQLVFSVDIAPPPLEIDLTLNRVGTVIPPKGAVTLEGTVSCSRPASVDLVGNASQRADLVIIRASFGTFVSCEGETPWSVTFIGENGRFDGRFVERPASVTVFASAFDEETGEFVFGEVRQRVRLRGAQPN
jgi:hypothetical protein